MFPSWGSLQELVV